MKQLPVFMEPQAHFHYNSCPLAAGKRTVRHDALAPPFQQLCNLAQRSVSREKHITVNFVNVQHPSPKIMDMVVDDPNNGATYHVDFHVLDSTAPSHRHIQKGSDPDSQNKSSLLVSMRDAVQKKATTYHRESNHHGATLLPFIITTVGGFTPRSPDFDARGQLNPKDALCAIFDKGVPPIRGTIPTSIEEGLVRSIAADAICGDRNVLYDQTLSRSSGIAMLHNQYLRRLSHAVIRGSADAVLDVLRRNF